MFVVADWAVFILTLVISSGIGIYYAVSGGKQSTTSEFLMGDRNIGLFPVALSILVSFQSAILILGVPAEIYSHGIQYFLFVVGFTVGGMLAARLFVPLFYPLKLTSMYQYLELRYKAKSVKLVGTVISIIATLIYSGIACFAPSTALKSVSGFPEWGSFLLIGCIVTFYTFMGGLKAVVWVDAFQALIMVIGLLAIVIQAMLAAGGIGNVIKVNAEWNRTNLWNFDPDPTVRQSFWSLTIASLIMSAGTHGCSQASIQRFSAVATISQAKQAIIVNLFGYILMMTLACLCGIAVFAYYATLGCDPLASRKIMNPNQIVPHFVSEMLPYPGFSGLFIACLYSGALSSLSSNLSSLCALTWEDVIKPFVKDKTEQRKAMFTRILVFVYGILGMCMAFAVRNMTGTVLQASLSFIGAAAGPLTGIVVLGAFITMANWKGAILGSAVSYIVMMWIGIGKYQVIGAPSFLPFPTSTCQMVTNQSSVLNTTMTTSMGGVASPPIGIQKLYELSFLWFPGFGLLICLVVGVVVSYLTGPMKREDVDDKYIIPVFKKLCCCLPTRNSRKKSYTINLDNDVHLDSILLNQDTMNTNNSILNGVSTDVEANEKDKLNT